MLCSFFPFLNSSPVALSLGPPWSLGSPGLWEEFDGGENDLCIAVLLAATREPAPKFRSNFSQKKKKKKKKKKKVSCPQWALGPENRLLSFLPRWPFLRFFLLNMYTRCSHTWLRATHKVRGVRVSPYFQADQPSHLNVSQNDYKARLEVRSLLWKAWYLVLCIKKKKKKKKGKSVYLPRGG